MSSLSPWTTRWPRFTWLSDGKPLRRLLLFSKAEFFVEVVDAHDASPSYLDPAYHL